MFYYQTSSLEPNLINNSAEEQQGKNIGKARLFREMGNLQIKGKDEQNHKEQRQNVKGGKNAQETKQINESPSNSIDVENRAIIKGLFETKRTDMLMNFSSEEQEETLQPQDHNIFNRDIKKNQFLLAFSDDENSQEDKSHNSLQSIQDKNERKQIRSKTKLPERSNKLILDFEDNSEEEGVQQTETENLASQRQRMKSLLSSLLNRAKEKYYIQPIQEGETLQCVIKREKNSNGVKYHIYDSATLRNFMTILKSEDGYIFVSKYESLSSGSETSKKQTVVGKLVSNFFGTEFNCFLCEYPYRRYGQYSINQDKNQQIMTIEYETNLFGLKGPRKMTAFIPRTLAKGIRNKKRLNEIYESQRKKKLLPTVQKYKNKTPKWNKSISAYVLNFYGRATVSSIKNFIMIHQNQPNDADARVLFGKYGKELFNLDISYPFNLIQGLSLALSSFDKKLACQ